jgi:hypothetical protein
VLGFVVSIGCQGRIAPLAAQQGSTVLIPLNDEGSAAPVGYGGTLAEDYQRGTLVYRLDGPAGPELVTRATGQALPPPSAPLARQSFAPKRQVVSLVDIPANAPLGTHTLHVVRERLEGGVPVEYPGPDYEGEITILPETLVVDAPGGPEVVTGAPTPFEKFACLFGNCAWSDATAHVRDAIPLPELRIAVSGDVAALELEIVYPTAVIAVQDLYEPPGQRVSHLARVWYAESPPGVLRVGAVAGAAPFSTLALAFSLVDGPAAILDPADVTVSVVGAWSESGAPVSASVVSKQIY